MNIKKVLKIGLGGGCHWCTEAVFMSLKGVEEVKQGWIGSNGENSALSEAVLLEYDSSLISLKDLIEVHLKTHASTSEHSMRKKYRSAVYVFDEIQSSEAERCLLELAESFSEPIITQVLKFEKFELNKEDQLEYFKKNRGNQFCLRYIDPKLEKVSANFRRLVNQK